jgi:hypothetical protein
VAPKADAKNRTILEELEAGNAAGSDVVPETREQSAAAARLIVVSRRNWDRQGSSGDRDSKRKPRFVRRRINIERSAEVWFNIAWRKASVRQEAANEL